MVTTTFMDISTIKPEIDCGNSSPGSRVEIILAAAKAGDKWAFAELCERCSPMVYRAIYRVLRNSADAEDALQDCFLRAYKGLGKFDERAAFSTWITRIGINSALSIIRKRRRCHEEPMYTALNDGDVWSKLDPPDKTMGPDEFYI